MASDDVASAMKLCVSCKACRRECPTGVDMAKMKIEALAARAARHGLGLRERLVAALPRYAPYASAMAPLANLRNRIPALARLGERVAGIAASRPLPAWRRDRFRDTEAGGDGDVLLLADTFNRAFEPENLRAALRVLRAAGFTPTVASAGGRPLCCGRTYLSAGLVDRARAEASRTLAALAGARPVVGLEPSCLLTLRDEFRSMLPGAESAALASRSMLMGEFLAKHAPKLALKQLEATAHVHGPLPPEGVRRLPRCPVHPAPRARARRRADHRLLLRHGRGVRLWRRDPGRVAAPWPKLGCSPRCGPPVKNDLIVADGTSCRHQIADLGGRPAVHSVRVLDRALA